MTANSVYVLRQPTLGIMFVDGQRIAVTVPENTWVRIVNGEIDGNRMMEVEWEGRKLQMFANDLKERGELVRSAGR